MNERTKSFYKKKFDDLRQYTYNFIPQEDEIFKQCNGITEPPYWFISNYGRLFSVYYKNEPLKQIRVNYTKSGTERKQHDWSYVTQYKGKQREPRLHRLVAKYFCKNEFDGYAEVAGEPLEGYITFYPKAHLQKMNHSRQTEVKTCRFFQSRYTGMCRTLAALRKRLLHMIAYHCIFSVISLYRLCRNILKMDV